MKLSARGAAATLLALGFSVAPLSVLAQPTLSFLPNATNDPSITVPSSGTYSHNWAGYVTEQKNITSVSGSWTVPAAQAGSRDLTANASWIGIGGASTHDLIQTGTQAIVHANGSTNYSAWYEILPATSVAVPLAVSAGDRMHASITLLHDDQWMVTITNLSTGKAFAKVISYHSSQNSAEWIEEMPSSSLGGYVPLDNFGTTTFTDALVSANGTVQTAGARGATPVSMITNAREVLAQTSVLTANGSGFTVMRTNVVSDGAAPVKATTSQTSSVSSTTTAYLGRRFEVQMPQRVITVRIVRSS